MNKETVEEGYSRKISNDWGGLPSHLDAAFTWENTGATYFFKGNKYWKFLNMSPAPGYPKTMKEGFPGIPSDVDSAFVWGGNGKIYFTKDKRYWKLDPERKPPVQKSQYPKPIYKWGLPQNIDGALQWENGKTYFFKAGQYWRFDDRIFGIAKASPSFPRSTSQWWFGC